MNTIANITNTPATPAQRGAWLRFHRFDGRSNFYGVVNKDGVWVDSSISMNTAVSWACLDAGFGNLDIEMHEKLEKLQPLGYSIVHDSLLEKLFYAGLLK